MVEAGQRRTHAVSLDVVVAVASVAAPHPPLRSGLRNAARLRKPKSSFQVALPPVLPERRTVLMIPGIAGLPWQ